MGWRKGVVSGHLHRFHDVVFHVDMLRYYDCIESSRVCRLFEREFSVILYIAASWSSRQTVQRITELVSE